MWTQGLEQSQSSQQKGSDQTARAHSSDPQRGHTIPGSTAACQRAVGSQPRWVPSRWQDTMNTDKVSGGTASSSPAAVSHVGTDRRSRVPHSPASSRQLLLPWEGGNMALGAARKVLYWSTEGNGCTTSHPRTGPSPGPFQPCTSSVSAWPARTHLSPALSSGPALGGLCYSVTSGTTLTSSVS